jgi:hypothetical protein
VSVSDSAQSLRAGPAIPARLDALARTYIVFATDHAALLELMFATKRRHETEGLHEAANRSFGTMLDVIADGQSTAGCSMRRSSTKR